MVDSLVVKSGLKVGAFVLVKVFPLGDLPLTVLYLVCWLLGFGAEVSLGKCPSTGQFS